MSEQFTDLDLKPNEVRFIQKYLETGNATEAARAYGSKAQEKNMAVRGSQLLKRLNHPINLLMAEVGLTSLTILRNVALGMNAENKHVSFDKLGNKHIYQSPDWSSRARFTDMAIRLSGGYPKNQLDLPFEIKNGQMVITAEFATHTELAEPGMEASA